MRRWLRSRRGIIWSLVLPLAIFLMGTIFGGAITGNQLLIVRQSNGPHSNSLIAAITSLQNSGDAVFKISYVDDLDSAQQQVAHGSAQAVLVIPEGYDNNLTLQKSATLELEVDNSNPLISGQISSTLRELTPTLGVGFQIAPVIQKQFDYIMFFASAVPVILASMSAYQEAGEPIVRDKEKEVWKRYIVTPVSNWDLVIGDVLSGTVRSLIACAIAYIVAVLIVGYNYVGLASFLSGFLVVFISVVGWVGFSVLVASRLKYNSYYSLGVLLNLVVFATSGMFYPVQGLPIWFRVLAYANPLTYTVDALRGIMLRRLTILDLGMNLVILLVFSAVMILVGVLSLRRHIE